MLRQTRSALGHQQALGDLTPRPRCTHPTRNHLPHRLVPHPPQGIRKLNTRRILNYHQYGRKSSPRYLPALVQPSLSRIMILPNNKTYLSQSKHSIALEFQEIISDSRMLRGNFFLAGWKLEP